MKLIIKNTSQHQTNSTTSTSQQNIPILLNTLTNTILEQALLFLVAVYTDMWNCKYLKYLIILFSFTDRCPITANCKHINYQLHKCKKTTTKCWESAKTYRSTRGSLCNLQQLRSSSASRQSGLPSQTRLLEIHWPVDTQWNSTDAHALLWTYDNTRRPAAAADAATIHVYRLIAIRLSSQNVIQCEMHSLAVVQNRPTTQN